MLPHKPPVCLISTTLKKSIIYQIAVGLAITMLRGNLRGINYRIMKAE
jgi:hypothetical protein